MSGLITLMGMSNGVNIDTLSNQVLIWDMTDLATLSIIGGKVAGITDKSGYGNDMVETLAERPSYFANGGANNKAHAYFDAGSNLRKSDTPTSFINSPLTFYMVIKLPAIPAAGAKFANGLINGVDGLLKQTNDWITYVGNNGAVYSYPSSLPNRTDFMIVKLVYNDDQNFWIEINDEPVGRILAGVAGGTLNIFSIISFADMPGFKFHEMRVFSEVPNPSKDQQIKSALISKYAIGRPVGQKNTLLFGDSHTSGIMSGTQTLGQYQLRMVRTHTYNIANEGFSGAVIDPGTYGQNAGKNFKDRYSLYTKSKWSDFFIVINYGTNDSAIRGANGALTRPQWVAAYNAYVQAFIDAGFTPAKIILVTPPYSTGTYVQGHLLNIKNDIAQIVLDKGLTLCDWYAAMVTAGQDINTVMGGDGIHGDDSIHTTLINTLTPLIV